MASLRVWFACLAVAVSMAAPVLASSSVFLMPPPDPRAVTVAGKGDGVADDTAAIQNAIDKAGDESGGLVFLPSGRYRISRTILVWPGVRIFGVGATRPVVVLGERTPGFASGVSYMVAFTGARRGAVAHVPFPPPGIVPFDPKIADAHSSTFYSAMSNVDIEIGDGNPAAAAIRFRVAQHAYLSHMDLRLGLGFAGIYQAGSFVRDLHFHGGRYGIVSEKTSPAWQFTVLDSTFDGQRSAAIREHEVGLTLVNVALRDTPVGIEIDKGYGDSLWGKDVRFERVRHAAVVISNESTVYTQVGFDHALAADTPVFARFRDSGKTVDGRGRFYRVTTFSHGLSVPAPGQIGTIATTSDITALDTLPPEGALAIRPLPPVADWFDARQSGAVGDGKADDTAALQRAIDGHRVVYLPSGRYRISDTLHLKPQTVLIALHPTLTQIVLDDLTPAYQGVAAPRPMIQTAVGGDAILSGFGLYTGGANPRATALLWMAGEDSLVDDVKVQGGHGTGLPPYNVNHTADNDPVRRWDGQYPSIWVTNGGGGTFNGIWSPNTFAEAGLYVSDTTTRGHVYQLSAEHHKRAEIVLQRVANWEFLAPQTEEEYGESRDAVSLEVRDSHDLLFANYHAYRVTRMQVPALAAVRLYNARNIRFRNVAVNAESGFTFCDNDTDCITYLRANKYPFENAIVDRTSGAVVRERQFAALDFTGVAPAPAAPSSQVKKLADGFFTLGGGAADSKGRLYFIDRAFQRIYRWSEAGLEVISDHPLDPVNLAVDASDHLLVLSSAGNYGSVFSLAPDASNAVIVSIASTPVGAHRKALLVLPTNWWVNGEFQDRYDPAHDRFTTLAEMFARDAGTAPSKEYASPDGSLALPAYRTVNQGPPDDRGWRFSHGLDSYGFQHAAAGSRIYISNSSEAKTYSAQVGKGGALTNLKVFVERGGESVASDTSGRVYLANGQIFVYGPDGRETGRIDVPERPLQLVIGGIDHHTLFILTNHALYSMSLAQAGLKY